MILLQSQSIYSQTSLEFLAVFLLKKADRSILIGLNGDPSLTIIGWHLFPVIRFVFCPLNELRRRYRVLLGFPFHPHKSAGRDLWAAPPAQVGGHSKAVSTLVLYFYFYFIFTRFFFN